MENLYLGIDIGSTTLKLVLLNETGKILNSLYQRTKPADSGRVRCSGSCNRCGACNFGQLRQTVDRFLKDCGIDSLSSISCTGVTGSQIVEDTHDFIPYDFKISEVAAHVAGARRFYPECEAILDVGGQDSKAMVFNRETNMWNCKMSGICAAGTGAFLDSVAIKLNVPIEEMPARADYNSRLEFSSVCAVLSATSINKFKNRFPLGEIIGGACKAQARTIMSGVGEIFQGYSGPIVFQGGVAYNAAVAHYLEEITGNKIVIPEQHGIIGALGAALLSKQYKNLNHKHKLYRPAPLEDRPLESARRRVLSSGREFRGRSSSPLIWRNLFFPAEILNAMGARILTLETYAAMFARNTQKLKKAFDCAACKGYTGESCSFLRVLEGVELPSAAFGLSTSQPCQQGERVFRDLVRNYNISDKFFSLQTPSNEDGNAVENLAGDLERSVHIIEAKTNLRMDPGKLAAACDYSNQAREWSLKCNDLRADNPPLLRGAQAIYFASIFSQMWGRSELVEIQKKLCHELEEYRDTHKMDPIDSTHRLIWLHLPPFYNTELLDYIELTCNAPIVFEEVNYIGWEPLDCNDPYRSLARKMLNSGFMDPELRVKAIIEQAARFKLNGCVLYNHGFGRCSMSDSSFIKHLREELAKSHLPLLVLDGDCMDQSIDPCSTYTKVSAYVEALNQQKFGNVFGIPCGK